MTQKKKLTFGISFPDERILQLAKDRAKARGMSLSAYTNQLIRKDLNLPGAFTPYTLAAMPNLDQVAPDAHAEKPIADRAPSAQDAGPRKA